MASRSGGGLDRRHLTAMSTGTTAAAPGATRHSTRLANKTTSGPREGPGRLQRGFLLHRACRSGRLPEQVLQLCQCSAAGAVLLLFTQAVHADRLF